MAFALPFLDLAFSIVVIFRIYNHVPKSTVRDFMCAVYIKPSLCWLLDLFFTNIFYFSTPKWTRVRRMSPVFCFLKKDEAMVDVCFPVF